MHEPIWAVAEEDFPTSAGTKAHLHQDGFRAMCGFAFPNGVILPAASWDRRCAKCTAIDRRGQRN